MRRRVVAAVWIAGATVPLLAAVFLAGCCVLPFHGVMHKLMPLCEMAASVVRGDHGNDHHEHEALPPAPARDKQEPVKRIATGLTSPFSPVLIVDDHGRALSPSASTSYRSFITLGAVRCDQDVGLNVLVATFLI
jgi:hypothetical protein